MVNDAFITAIATMISAGIAGLVAWAVARSSSKSEVRKQELTSRTDIEKEAFDRAKGYYTDTIDRQSKEIHEQSETIDRLETQVSSLRETVNSQGRIIQEQGHEIAELKQQLLRATSGGLMQDETNKED